MTRRRAMLLGGGGLLLCAGVALAVRKVFKFPPDTTPEGAYMRIAHNVAQQDPRAVFDYLEDAAQHAAFTIRGYRKDASALVDRSYPEPERTRLLEEYRAHADAADGADVWVDIANARGWIGRLRRDLSGVFDVETEGSRATVVTVRGTRYPFRRRDNGIWGLTMFTADLTSLAERAARDFDVVKRAAEDYARVE